MRGNKENGKINIFISQLFDVVKGERNKRERRKEERKEEKRWRGLQFSPCNLDLGNPTFFEKKRKKRKRKRKNH